MKRLVLVAMSFAATLSFGQVTDGEKNLTTVNKDTVDGWKKGGYFSLTGSQVSLTNWVAGGQNSIAVNSLFGLYANLKKGDMTWENSMEFGYGILKQGDKLFSKTSDKWIKTDDRLNLASKYGKKASDNWYYAGLLNFRTQTTAGYDYVTSDEIEISGFLAPAYTIGAIGMDFKPANYNNDNRYFSLFIAPVTAKLTFVNDQILADAGAFGVTAAEKDLGGFDVIGTGNRFRAEFGGYLRMQYKTKLSKNISYSTKLDLFSNYLDGHPERIDVNWDNLLEFKLWKFLSATLSTSLVYDDDIDISNTDELGVTTAGPRVQFKEVLGVGLSWKFQ